jgi:hypothetical protein
MEIFSSVHLSLLLMPFNTTWIFRSDDPPLTKYTIHKTHKENQLRRNDSADQQILLSRPKCLQSVRIVYNVGTTRHELSLNWLFGLTSRDTGIEPPTSKTHFLTGLLRFYSVLSENLFFVIHYSVPSCSLSYFNFLLRNLSLACL